MLRRKFVYCICSHNSVNHVKVDASYSFRVVPGGNFAWIGQKCGSCDFKALWLKTNTENNSINGSMGVATKSVVWNICKNTQIYADVKIFWDNDGPTLHNFVLFCKFGRNNVPGCFQPLATYKKMLVFIGYNEIRTVDVMKQLEEVYHNLLMYKNLEKWTLLSFCNIL